MKWKTGTKSNGKVEKEKKETDTLDEINRKKMQEKNDDDDDDD